MFGIKYNLGMQNERLPQWTPVFIALGRNGTDLRSGKVLADRGDTVIVEYHGPSGYRNKIVRRERVTPYSGGRQPQIVRED